MMRITTKMNERAPPATLPFLAPLALAPFGLIFGLFGWSLAGGWLEFGWMTAFKNLPPWSDFVKGRESPTLHMRQAFTDWPEEMHLDTMTKTLIYGTAR